MMSITSWGWSASSTPQAIGNGIRVNAMGGAFVAIADKEDVLQHNPAGLTSVDRLHVDILHTSYAFSTDFIRSYKKVMGIQDKIVVGGETSLKAFTSSELTDMLAYNLNSNGAARIVFLMPNFGIGYYGTFNIDLDIDQEISGISAKYDIRADSIILLGYAREWIIMETYPLSIGMSLKYINRGRVNDRRHAIEFFGYGLKDLPQEDDKGIGLDFGFLINSHPDVKWGFAINDIGGTKLTTSLIRPNVRFGVTYSPEESPIQFPFLVSFELANLFDNNYTFGKKMHIGAEAYPIGFLALRLGINQGYPTFGIGLKGGSMLNIDYAYYTQEKGGYVGQTPYSFHEFSLRIGY